MPGLDGRELCRQIREEMRLADLPILMCSAKGLECDFESLRALWNVAEMIYKPFSMRRVVSLAENLAGMHRVNAT
jgi:DNA-binding response OmpR family regulator